MSDQNKQLERVSSGLLSWVNVRDLLVIAMVVVLTVRLCFMQVSVDLSSFNFTDLLSMFLAVSAIALSAAFYFKADESSRSFYNNTYQFTKDVSEILGRIEAGFGERLKHIDESYSGLSQKFDRFPYDKSGANADEENKQAEIQEQEAKRQDIIEDLMRRAHVAGQEKTELVQKLSTLSSELEKSRQELTRLRAEESQISPNNVSHGSFKHYMRPIVATHYDVTYLGASPSAVRQRFVRILNDERFDREDRAYMEANGLLRDGRLTVKGAAVISDVISSIYND